ncbi:Retinol dehydrogenase 12 [Orchesella cincta]|uniref:Retinol dehydrogenase 12 n=1 Tax=Orchesella cincta TaxID=48709 RepID=A0A1D2NAI7_ORCCI|nr:Retinol dehydrogenase 12 [Orchesella cincta]
MWLSFLRYCILIFGVLTVIRWVLRKKWGSVDKTNEIKSKGKIVLITGANTGIGKATALEFAKRDANIILACRDLEKAREAVVWIRQKTTLGQLICMQLDLSSLQSVRNFCKEFRSKYDRLDILINNAGLMVPTYSYDRQKTADGHEVHFGVNHLGHFLLTNLLLEPLKASAPSRVVTLSSMAHSWGTIDFDDLNCEKTKIKGTLLINPLYSNSKLANALFSKELSKRLQGTGIRTYALCPGMVMTDFGRNMKGPMIWVLSIISPIIQFLLKSPKEGAATVLYCSLSKNLINESGEMYQNCGKWDPNSRIQLKDEDAKRLWEESAKLVGL